MSSASFQRLLFPGLLLMGLSLPLSKSASNVLLAAVYLGAAAGALASREFRDNLSRSWRQPLTAALALVFLVALAGILNTETAAAGFSVANKFASLPAIYFLVSVLLQSHRDEEVRNHWGELLLLSFLVGVAVLNLLGVLTFLGAFGDTRYVLPLAPNGMHHIWYSNLNALGSYTAVAFLLFSRAGASTRARVLLGGFLLVAAAGILLSMSRTAWFGTALTAAILAAVTIRRFKTLLLVALLALVAALAVYRFVPLVRDRVDHIATDIDLYAADENAGNSLGGRLLLWRAALRMFKAHPVVGVGTGDFVPALREMRRTSRLVPKFLMRFNQPHNTYLFALATNGSVGLGALLYLYYRCLRAVAPGLRADGSAKFFAFLALATVVHFMVAGSMDSFFNIQVLRYAFAFILGVCVRGCASCVQRG